MVKEKEERRQIKYGISLRHHILWIFENMFCWGNDRAKYILPNYAKLLINVNQFYLGPITPQKACQNKY